MAEPSVNLLSWLRPEKIIVAYADRPWRLEARTAADWLGGMAMDFDTLSGIFPGLICDDDVDDMSQLLKTPGHEEGLEDVARKVVQAAGGRDWWWTVSLAKKSLANWILVNGFLVRQGVRADAIGFPDWLDACYTWLWERGDEEQRTKLDIELSLPPRGARRSGAANRRMAEAFQAD